MGQLFENDLKVGDPIIYNGLGTNRKAIIIKRTKRTITFKCAHSTVKLTFISGIPASDLGISLDLESFRNFEDLDSADFKINNDYFQDWNAAHYSRGKIVLLVQGNCDTIILITTPPKD